MIRDYNTIPPYVHEDIRDEVKEGIDDLCWFEAFLGHISVEKVRKRLFYEKSSPINDKDFQ